MQQHFVPLCACTHVMNQNCILKLTSKEDLFQLVNLRFIHDYAIDKSQELLTFEHSVLSKEPVSGANEPSVAEACQ